MPVTSGFFKILKKKAIILLSIFLFSINQVNAQIPNWVATTPSTGTVGPTTIPINYGIDRVGTVYVAVLGWNSSTEFSGGAIKGRALTGPGGGFVNTAILTINVGQVGAILQYIAYVTGANTPYTVYVVAEGTVAGSLQLMSTRIIPSIKTLPCPKINILTGFTQPSECYNTNPALTALAKITILLDDPVEESGILKGTKWTFIWGDNDTTRYTSLADYDLPPATIKQHRYTTKDNCNYNIKFEVINPCGEKRVLGFTAVVHGRDIPADGNGILSIVNNAGGSSVVQVCEGTSPTITLRDNSTWNCQGVAMPNSDLRFIQWLYGKNPSDVIENTITGPVTIDGLPAPQTGVRSNPVPYGPSSLSQAITIPASAKAGQFFRVYLKNWNKCNSGIDDYVYTSVDIQIVAAPTPPTADNKNYCIDDVKTLSIKSAPTGTITWYYPNMSTPVDTGVSYNSPLTIPNTYTYYVTDRQVGGLACESAPTAVTLTINKKPGKPSISGSKKQNICYGIDPPYVITAKAATDGTPITGYQWFLNGNKLTGRISDTIMISKPGESGSFSCSTLGISPTYCLSPLSDTLKVTVHTLKDIIPPADMSICQGQDAWFHASTTEIIATWHWEVSKDGGLTFKETGEGPPYSFPFTDSVRLTTPPATFNGYYYRVEMKTPNGQGGCAFKSPKALLTINGLPTAYAGTPISRCSTTPLAGIAMTGATQGGTASSVIWSGGETMGSWTQNANPALAVFTPSQASGSFTATLTVTGAASCGVPPAVSTRPVAWSQTPAAEAGANIARCDLAPTAAIPMTGSTVTGTYSSFAWSGGAGQGAWTPNADPALAVFTPTTVSGSFTATLSVTGKDACLGTNASDTRLVSWGQAPVLIAGGDLSRCDLNWNAAFAMTGASATGTFTDLTWSNLPAGGTWAPNADPALATYTPAVTWGSVVATLKVTGTGACTGLNPSVSRNIEWSQAATVSAGADQSVCATGDVTLVPIKGGSATSFTWTGGTGTYTPDNLTFNPVYRTSIAERGAHAANLTITTNDPGGICPAVSDDIHIEIGTIISGATLTSSGDGCTGIAPWLNIAITGGAPPYTLQYKLNGAVKPNKTNYYSGTNWELGILPAGTYIYDITVISDPCGNSLPVTLSKTIIVYQQPVANPGSDKGVCNILDAPLSATASVGTRLWSQVSGPGTITFADPAAPATTATASIPGAYVVRWKEQNGVCTDSRDINVYYETLAAVAGPTQDLCGTPTATLVGNAPSATSGIWTKVSGPLGSTVTFSPNASSPTADATVSAYGTYVFRWTLGNPLFCTRSADVTVTFEKPAAAGSEQRLCGLLAANLTGNVPTLATSVGTWTLDSGPAGGAVSFTGAAGIHTPAAKATVTIPGEYYFRWTIANGPCSTSSLVKIVYNPAGQVNDITGQALCNGSNTTAVIFSTSNLGGTTTYSWTNNQTSINLAASGMGDIPAFTAVNTGTAPLTATITVTPTYSDGFVNCTGLAKSFTITVNPDAVVTQPLDKVFCNAVTTPVINFGTTNTGGNMTYTWSNSNPSIGLAASGTGPVPAFIPENTGFSPVEAIITVLPEFEYLGVTCTGTSKSFKITVNPSGHVFQPENLTICDTKTGTVTFTTEKLVGLTTYSWTNTNTAINLTATGSGDISFTGTNSTDAPISGTIEVTPTFTFGGVSCTGPKKTFTITVNPAGQVNQPDNVKICNGATGTISFVTTRSGGLTTYEWTNTNTTMGLGASGSGPITFIAENNGIAPVMTTVTVTPTFNNGSTDCPGTSKSFTITVYPTPKLTSLLTPPDICSNTAFSYTPVSSTFGTTFSWTRPDVMGITPAGPTSGTNNPNEVLHNITNIPLGVLYKYTLSADGCDNTQNVVVNVKPEPVINPVPLPNVCSGNSVNYHINLTNFTNPDDDILFTWPAPTLFPVNPGFTGGNERTSASKVNISDVFTNTMGIDGTATYKVTPYKNGCAGAPQDIVVTVRSQPVLSNSLNTIVCSNDPIGLVLATAAGSVSADSYDILSSTLEDGLSPVAIAPVAAYAVTTTYLQNDVYKNITGVNKTVTYSIRPKHNPDCYGTPVDVVITIRPEPYIVPVQKKEVCSGIAIGKEVLLSPVNSPAGTVFNWSKPSLTDFSGQGTAGVNVTADPSGKLHINDVIYNYTGAPIIAIYTITPSTGFCSGAAIPVEITVDPEPQKKIITGRDKICINEKNIIYEVPVTASSTFHWSVDAAVGVKTFDYSTNAIIINAAAAPGAGLISVYETNIYGCAGDLTDTLVTVYLQAAPENVTGPDTVCANSTEVYSVTSRAGSVYTWFIPGGAAIAGDPSLASVSVIWGNVGGKVWARETNIAGCITDHKWVDVVVKPLPVAILTGGGTICDGGTIPLSVDFGGTGPFDFTYAVNGVAQPPVHATVDPYTLNATLAGTYTIVNVTDKTGCTSTGIGSAVVTYHMKPTGTISGTNTICGGTSTTLTMSFTGLAPYTFSYTDGTTTLTIPAYPNPVYTVSVTPGSTATYTLVSLTDGHACAGMLSGSAIITVNAPPSLTLTGKNLTCWNDNSGEVKLVVAGSSPFGFVWAGPAGYTDTHQDITGLKAGTYTVTVNDTKGCTSAGSVTLTEPGEVKATLSSANIVCFGTANGTITISAASGGSGVYEYTKNGGASWEPSGNYTGLTPGLYNVQVRDIAAPVCSKVLNADLEITSPAQLTATVSKTDIICFGAANGTITVSSPSGGSGSYEYSRNGGAGWSGSGNFVNLTQASYIVMIRDAAYPTCTRTLGTITINEQPELSATVTHTNITCFGATDGTITIGGATGGSLTFEYSINGGGSWQPAGNYTGLTPGTYSVMIRDKANPSCYKSLDPMLLITQLPVLKATVNATMVTCNGVSDGKITFSGPTGGSGAYEYTIDNWAHSGTVLVYSGLAPGTYNAQIRDQANPGCVIILNSGLDITQPDPLSGTVTKTNITCALAANGTITINNSLGGYGTYEYSKNGGFSWQVSNSFTGVTAGKYDVMMRDRTRTTCSLLLADDLEIIEPSALHAGVTYTDVTCFNANDGTITISGETGGYGTYQYSINGGASWSGTGTFTNLAPNSYSVVIRDAASTLCQLNLGDFIINEPAILGATAAKTNITCFAAADGTITVNAAAGGHFLYEYSIDGGGSWQDPNTFTGLTAGFYNVKMRDAVKTTCILTVNASMSIIEPSILNGFVTKSNVTCHGFNDGTITISSATGGYGPYEFSIDGGANWQSGATFSGLGPDTYNVMIHDVAHPACARTLASGLVITEPDALFATVTSNNITCFGANNGSITISGATGGSGMYEYTIDGGANWEVNGNFAGLVPNSHDVRIRDAVNTGCELSFGSLSISEPTLLLGSFTKTNITCFGAGDGIINITGISGGSGTYEFTINGGGSWQLSPDFTGLGPGSYNLQLRDKVRPSCVLVINTSVSITQQPVLNAVVTPVMITCNGKNDGIINITGSAGGYGTFDYTIDGGLNWTGTTLYTGLVPGNYDVRIRDAAHIACAITLKPALAVTEPAALTGTVNSTNITCNSLSDGTITISAVSGGYGTYEYTINGAAGWQASPSFTALGPGSYDVRIRDKAHPLCEKILNGDLKITEQGVLSATVTQTNISCFGAANGSIVISAPTGGYGTYDYSIDGGITWQSSGTFTGLLPNTYNIWIRDAAHILCAKVLPPAIVITQPDVLSATVSSTNITCNGAGDGTITISGALGGYLSYEYSIDAGLNWQSSGSFINLAPGYYNVQLRDKDHISCVKILDGGLRITEKGPLSATVVKYDITCNTAGDGRIVISLPTGGYGNYEYSTGGAWQSSGTFTGLTPAPYVVQMRDRDHTACVAPLGTFTIEEPIALSAAVAFTDITCKSSNDGTISVTGAAGGWGPVQYSKDGGLNWTGSGMFTNLAPASYNIKIRDAANILCVNDLGNVLISEPDALSATAAATNVTCAGAADGTISITLPLGGSLSYEYSINGGGSWQDAGLFTALVPGNYNVQMRDKLHTGCVKVINASLPVTQPAILNAVISTVMVTCNSKNDGIINLSSPTGGSGGYEYNIGGTWQDAASFTGLAPGTYDVKIRDKANTACVITLNSSVSVTEPQALTATVTKTDATCSTATDGTINITSPAGGYGTFEYNTGAGWQGTGLFTNLAPGFYNVQIRDKAHPACVIILNAALEITKPTALNATVAHTDVTCNSANDGTITITGATGGYLTYQYSVNGGASWQSSGTFTGLAPIAYTVIIRDAANPLCMVTLESFTITQPDVLSATVTSTNVTCNSANDGTISVTLATGGHLAYEYSVDAGAHWQASGNFINLAPGFYNVQIRDEAYNACVKTLNASLQISEPSPLAAGILKTNVTCHGFTDGTITILSTSGGYGPYEYSIGGLWQSSNIFPGLAPATYAVQMRDKAYPSCVKLLDGALVIEEPALLFAAVNATMVTCNGANDGNILISGATGGSGLFQYSIKGGASWQGAGSFMNLAPGMYNVIIRDAMNPGCIITLDGALEITQPGLLNASLARTNVTCFGGSDGTITISSPSGGYTNYEYSVNGGGSWQPSGSFTSLSPGLYTVLIRDKDHITCMRLLNGSYAISQPGMLTATVNKTDVTCNGAMNGTISITAAAGGSLAYDYSIDGGLSWQPSGLYTGLVPKSYDVRIRDAAATTCSNMLYPNLVISEPLTLAMTSTGNILLDCFDDRDGTGTFFGSGGTLPYTFTVTGNTTGATIPASGFNSQSFFNAGTGVISVQVTDSKGCTASGTITITQPALLTPGSIGIDQQLCSGQNPALISETVPATGGPAAYSYQWQYAAAAGGPFITIAGATVFQYTPPAGATTTLYYRRMVSSGTCAPQYSNVIEIKVYPLPLATLTGGDIICPGEISKLNINIPVGTGPFDVDIENYPGLTIPGYASGADINVSPAITTTYRLLRVRDSNGCTVTSPSVNLMGNPAITVNILPSITKDPVDRPICEYGMVSFDATATGSDLTYQWFVDQGTGVFQALGDTSVYTGANSPVLNIFGALLRMNGYKYRVEVSGCSSTKISATATLTVNMNPVLQTQPKDSTICMNNDAAFTVEAAATGLAIQWQVRTAAGFVNVTEDAVITGSKTGTLVIKGATAAYNNKIFRAKITGICGSAVYSNFVTLKIFIPPVITKNPDPLAVCDGTIFGSFSSNGSGQIDSLRWQVDDGSGWKDISDNSIYSGTSSQQLTLSDIPLAYNGYGYRLGLKSKCTIVYSSPALLTVHSNPVVDFSGVSPVKACGGVPVVLDGNPAGGSGVYTQNIWTGDVGPLNNYYTQTPTFNPSMADSFVMNYRVKDSNGCYGDGDLTVNVDSPSADFIIGNAKGCAPLAVTLTKDMTGLAKFWWNFGDGSPIDSITAEPVHTYRNANPAAIEYYDLTLKVMSPLGCYDVYSMPVTLNPEANASFTASNDTVCSGTALNFSGVAGAAKYFWDFKAGESGYSATENTTHLFINDTQLPVARMVSLTTTTALNCSDTNSVRIVVMPSPTPMFTPVPNTQVFNPAGNNVTFTNSSKVGVWNWTWSFGDGGVSGQKDPVHTYTNVGKYNVTLKVSNATCSDSVKHQVEITPIPPVANFDEVANGCTPLSITINNTSLNTLTPGTTFYWTFGDGSISTSKNPTYVYTDAGAYRIELTVTGPGGTSIFSRVVEAYPSPMANLKVSPNYVFVNDEPVRFFNLSQGATAWVWDFGDGDTSHMKEPSHKYMEEGIYDITLWASSANGCIDQYILSPGVTVEPAGELRFSTVFRPNLSGAIDLDNLPTGQEMDMYFFPPIREKVLEYKLQIFNRWGVLIFETRNINIPWNGYYKQELCPQGVYVWYVEGKYANGSLFRKAGDITLLH